MEELQPHIKCRTGDIAETVLLSGDPGRSKMIAEEFLADAKQVADNRGLPVWTGNYKDRLITAATSGMGCPSASIVVEELANIGAKNIIRIGTCGALKEEIKSGDLIVPIAALREDGTTNEYIFPEFPAVASPEVFLALTQSAKAHNATYWTGINRTHDAFYEHISTILRWAKIYEDKRFAQWHLPLISSEMECSAIFLIATLRGLKAGAVLTVVTTQPLEKIAQNPDLVYEIIETGDTQEGISKAVQTALDAAFML